MIIDVLLGRNILGESMQVTNMEGLLGKFNSILMNKILVMVDEVAMTRKGAEQVKGMITGEMMNFEKKGLDKIVLKNHMDFVFTSNNDFCVYIDIHDRRYFILDVDDSNANDQQYYMRFNAYCHDPVTAFHVYKYLMSIDISTFNPFQIPETDEKQMYRENAIPTSIRFMQYYAESAIFTSQFQYSMWRPIVRPDELFLQFCQYCDQQREVKKWTAKAFQMSITKYLGFRADVRDQSNHGDRSAYNLGPSAEEFIARLRDKKLYSRF